jgi:predicted RNA-binding protein YlqC (UPF0109 family)
MTDNYTIDEQALRTILLNIVTVPEDIKIDRHIDEQGVLLSIIVNPKDMGIVIGRGGSMVDAIKTIMRAVGKAKKMNIRIQFLEPDGSIRYSAKPQIKESGDGEDVQNVQIDSDSIEDDLKDFVVN